MTLDDSEILLGIEICAAKASQLLSDGELLADQESYSSAGGLGVASLEEVGKAFLLGAMLSVRSMEKAAWKAFWRAFRTHEAKRLCAGWVGAGFPDIRQLKRQDIIVDIGQLDLIRRSALYVDRHEGRWITGLLSAQDADSFLRNAHQTWEELRTYAGAGGFDRIVEMSGPDRYSAEHFVRDLLGKIAGIAKLSSGAPASPEEIAKLMGRRRPALVRFFRP